MILPKHLLDAIHQGNVHKFYISNIWRKVRLLALRRDNFECQNCKAKGLVTPATCVHHKVHLKDNPLLALVLSNLISLCDPCHNLEHPEKLNKMCKNNTNLCKKDEFLLNHEEKW